MEKTKKQYQSEHTKEQIVSAVIHLLVTKGYGNTSITDISQESGLTKGALYHHFKDKEEVFYRAISYLSDVLKRNLIVKVSASGDSLQRLRYLFDTFIELNENNNQYVQIVSSLILGMGDLGTALVKPLEEFFSELSYYIERIIVKGQTSREINPDLDAKLLSFNIIGMLFGNTIPWVLNKDRINYKAMMNVQKEILLKSLKIS